MRDHRGKPALRVDFSHKPEEEQGRPPKSGLGKSSLRFKPEAGERRWLQRTPVDDHSSREVSEGETVARLGEDRSRSPGAHGASSTRAGRPREDRGRSRSPSSKEKERRRGDSRSGSPARSRDGEQRREKSRSGSRGRSAGRSPSGSGSEAEGASAPGARRAARRRPGAKTLLVGALAAGAPAAANGMEMGASIGSLLVPARCPAACVRTLLMVVAMGVDGPSSVLMPAVEGYLFGAITTSSEREAALSVADGVLQGLKVPLLPLGSVLLPAFETTPAEGDVQRSVDRVVAVPWQPPGELPSSSEWRWCTLPMLAGVALVYELAVFAFARIASYRSRSARMVLEVLLNSGSMLRSGARALAWAARDRESISSGRACRQEPWLASKAHTEAADEVLKAALRKFCSIDVEEQAYVRSFADRVSPAVEEEVPPSFRRGNALPSFADPALAKAPFSVRVQPPRTTWLSGGGRRRLPPAHFKPDSWLDLLTSESRRRYKEWTDEFREWLISLAECADDPDGDAMRRVLKARPAPLIISREGLVPDARDVIWDCRGQRPVPLDLDVPIETHLNLDYVRAMRAAWPTWPDQELFAHLLEGARYKSAPVEHILLQPHLVSLPRALSSTHKELARLVEKGFFGIFYAPPFVPWNTFPMGAVFRKLEPDRPRRTTDGNAPRKGLGRALSLVDDMGRRLVPINVQSKWPAEDVARGTIELFYRQWETRLGVARGVSPLHFMPVVPETAEAAQTGPLSFASSGATTGSSRQRVRRSTILIVFAGSGRGDTRLAACLERAGFAVLEIDIRIGGDAHDLSIAKVFEVLLARVARGEFVAIFAAPPCATFSIAHEPQLRSALQPSGLSTVPAEWKVYLLKHTALAERTAQLLLAAEQQALPWMVENPSWRGDESSPAYWEEFADHGALWKLPSYVALAALVSTSEVTFAQCELGTLWQKYTTLLGSCDLIRRMPALDGLRCRHSSHAETARGRRPSGSSRSAESACYPPLMSAIVADSFVLCLQLADPSRRDSQTVALRSLSATGSLPKPDVVDVVITRRGSVLEFANPFKCGPSGRDGTLAALARDTYAAWLEKRNVTAADFPSALPVAERLVGLKGADVEAAVQALVDRHGAGTQFNLLCSRRCRQCGACHGETLRELFLNILSGAGVKPWPRELKISVGEIMNDLALLMHLGQRIKVPVYQLTSDVKDFFNQHYLAPTEWNKVGLLTLDLDALQGDLDSLRKKDPPLVALAEYVLGFGLSPNSNICQRHAYLLVFKWFAAMEKAAAPIVAALRRRYPPVAAWLDWRAANLEPRKGKHVDPCLRLRFAQARLWTASMFTDDLHEAALGVDLTILALRVWRQVTTGLNLTMAIVLKHEIGQCVKTQGVMLHTGLGIAYVPQDKLRRALSELHKVATGSILLRDYRSLVGLLQSLLFLVAMRRSATYGLYTPFAGALEIDPEELLRATPLIQRQVAEWARVLSTRAGISFEAGVPDCGFDELKVLEAAPAIFYARSDASKEGAELPGLGAALGGLGWRFPNEKPLSAAHLSLPIAVTEFVAAVGCIISFADLVPAPCILVLEVDALATADALTTDAARSPLMQHVHRFLLRRPEYRRIFARLIIAHVHGERNVLSDGWSRGKFETLRRLCAQLGMAYEQQPAPEPLEPLLDELVELMERMPTTKRGETSEPASDAPQPKRTRLLTPHEQGLGGEFCGRLDKDGPSPSPPPSAPSSRAPSPPPEDDDDSYYSDSACSDESDEKLGWQGVFPADANVNPPTPHPDGGWTFGPCHLCSGGHRESGCENNPPTCHAWSCSRGMPCAEDPSNRGASLECCDCERVPPSPNGAPGPSVNPQPEPIGHDPTAPCQCLGGQWCPRHEQPLASRGDIQWVNSRDQFTRGPYAGQRVQYWRDASQRLLVDSRGHAMVANGRNELPADLDPATADVIMGAFHATRLLDCQPVVIEHVIALAMLLSERSLTLHEQGLGGEFSHQVEKDGAAAAFTAKMAHGGVLTSPQLPLRESCVVVVNLPPEHGAWGTRLNTFVAQNGLSLQRVKGPSVTKPKDLSMVIWHNKREVARADGTGVFGDRVNDNIETLCHWALAAAWWAIEYGDAPAPQPLVPRQPTFKPAYTDLHRRELYHHVDLTTFDGSPAARRAIVANAVEERRSALPESQHKYLDAVFVDGEGQGWCTCGGCLHRCPAKCRVTHVQVALLFADQSILVVCDYVDSAAHWASVVSDAATPPTPGNTLFAVWGGEDVDARLARSLFDRVIIDVQSNLAFRAHLLTKIQQPALARARESKPLSLKWAAHALRPPLERPDLPYDAHKGLHHERHIGCWQRQHRELLTDEHRAYAAVDGFVGALACHELLAFSRGERRHDNAAAPLMPPELATLPPVSSPPAAPPAAPTASVRGAAESDLPKPARLIKAEMGITFGKERHLLVVSLADDLQAVASAWCAAHSLPDQIVGKIVAQLQTRLDAALAQAHQEVSFDSTSDPGDSFDFVDRRFHVLTGAEEPGIYHGQRREVEPLVQRRQRTGGATALRSFAALAEAVDYCFTQLPIIEPTFRGPESLELYPLLRIGDDASSVFPQPEGDDDYSVLIVGRSWKSARHAGSSQGPGVRQPRTGGLPCPPWAGWQNLAGPSTSLAAGRLGDDVGLLDMIAASADRVSVLRRVGGQPAELASVANPTEHHECVARALMACRHACAPGAIPAAHISAWLQEARVRADIGARGPLEPHEQRRICQYYGMGVAWVLRNEIVLHAPLSATHETKFAVLVQTEPHHCEPAAAYGAVPNRVWHPTLGEIDGRHTALLTAAQLGKYLGLTNVTSGDMIASADRGWWKHRQGRSSDLPTAGSAAVPRLEARPHRAVIDAARLIGWPARTQTRGPVLARRAVSAGTFTFAPQQAPAVFVTNRKAVQTARVDWARAREVDSVHWARPLRRRIDAIYMRQATDREALFQRNRATGIDSHAGNVAAALEHDESNFALRPSAFRLHDLCARLFDPTTAQATSTSSGQRSAWKHWAAWCLKMNTDPWRAAEAVSQMERNREAVLQAGFLRFCHNRQSARSGRLAALPSSATKTLAHIRKLHRDRGCPMVSSALVNTESRRLHYEYRGLYGVAAMIPKRKEPFTRRILERDILGSPHGLALGPNWELDWSSLAGRSLAALTCTLAQTGFRKAEICIGSRSEHIQYCLKCADLRWMLGGVPTDSPTAAQLSDLGDGDYAVITPPPSKSDPFDMVWGGNPIWLPYIPDEPLCAAAAIAALMQHRQVTAPQTTALFVNNDGAPFTAGDLSGALRRMLLRVYPEATVSLYSWHSARIYLCTSLVEANVSRAQIQAICRWQTEESIDVYGRLTAQTYGDLLRRALRADIDTARAHNLMLVAPFVDQRDVAAARAVAIQAPPGALDVADAALDDDIDPDVDADQPDEPEM